MKPACTHTYFIEIMPDRQTPASHKGDVMVIGGSYMRELCGILKREPTHK